MVGTVLGIFQCLGVLLFWIIVGQGPTVLAVGAGSGCLDIFLLPMIFFFPFSEGQLDIDCNIVSQPTNHLTSGLKK